MRRSSGHISVREPQISATEFSSRLQAAMWARGWTMDETARRVRERLGEGATFSRTNISHYVMGRCIPKIRYLQALSEVLGIDKTELLGARSTADEVSPNAYVVGENGKLPQPTSPALHIEDRGTDVWLQINQQVPWPVAMKVLQALKG
jgi:transcriptional regulator with XRE-family HTH domain